jgi:c-di-GMP-binding flagellar brake protein YcgR
MKPAEILPEDSERYLIQHAPSVERLLKEVMESNAIVSLYVEHGLDFILSSIIAIDDKNGLLLLEQGVDQHFNRRLIEAEQVVCTTTHNQVYIQFTGADLKPVLHQGEAAFQVKLPQSLLRLQRRESYRLATSVMNPVKCMINTGQSFIETVVVDISVGGVGILAYEGSGILKAGEVYHGCRIALPGSGEFAVSLTVCTTFDVALKNGKLTHRAGCEFQDLPASVETEIQRYIIRTDRERRGRYV